MNRIEVEEGSSFGRALLDCPRLVHEEENPKAEVRDKCKKTRGIGASGVRMGDVCEGNRHQGLTFFFSDQDELE